MGVQEVHMCGRTAKAGTSDCRVSSCIQFQWRIRNGVLGTGSHLLPKVCGRILRLRELRGNAGTLNSWSGSTVVTSPLRRM